MNAKIVSVIIPTYNGGDHLEMTIQSVMNQTYPDFELVIVDDGSTDNTVEVVKKFNDPRLKLIDLGKNQGADAARNIGIRQSTGDIIAFLDQDDIYHPEKLQIHVEYMEGHPDVGFTYNARYELNHSSETIREISSPPKLMTLKDIVLSHKLSPSEMVFKRDWIFRVGLLDETHNFHGGEIIFAGYLFMEGCKFANVNRVLNYRRYHTERLYKNLSDICKDERDAQDKIFFDPRCPKRVRSVRNLAHVNMYLYFICLAFAQDETVLGRELVLNAISLKPDILSGKPCRLVNAFLEHSIEDENKNHKTLLKKFFSQLPSDLVWLSKYENWAIARGYFDKGMRAIIWGRIEDGEENLSKLDKMTFQVDESYFQSLTHQLMDYASEFGPTAAEGVILILDPYLKKIGGLGNIMRLRGSYVINRAFRAYRRGKFSVVPLNVLTAVTYEPKYIVNKGVLSILFRSLIKILSGIIKNLYGLYSRSVNSMIFNILIVVSF